MGMTMVFSRVFILMTMLFCLAMAMIAKAGPQAKPQVKVFDVRKYGAVADGHTDNTKAFLRAWNDACQSKRKARVYIPSGTFLLGSVTFSGPCKNSVVFLMKGVLKAPTNPASMEPSKWVAFRYVDRLEVTGGRTLDGQGHLAWQHNNCLKDPNCKLLPTSIRFELVKNSMLHHITSVDSKTTHFRIFGCSNLHVNNVRISAPGESPNTDGIKISTSNHITISNTRIATGDDCVALISGSSGINVSDVSCGPGHGISIGSLGKSPSEKNVVGVSVKNCTFSNTTNGLRIKTWGTSVHNVASGFTYENIYMNNVQNPIVIDQHYCPARNCKEVPSHVQVKDVTFKNIWGVSNTKVAVNLQCSQSFPCRNIILEDINLACHGPEGAAISSCAHVIGHAVSFLQLCISTTNSDQLRRIALLILLIF